MDVLLRRARLLPESAQDERRRRVEERGERRHEPGPADERRAQDARERSGCASAAPFRRELAEHDVQVGDERERRRRADRDADRLVEREAAGLPRCSSEPVAERRFGQGADGEAGESNS